MAFHNVSCVSVARTLLWTSLVFASAGDLCCADRLSEIIENVERNETLYKSFDVLLQDSYSIGDRPADKFKGGGQREITGHELRIHYVSQEGAFRVEVEGKAIEDGGKPVTRDRITLFDGKTTKRYDQNAYLNIWNGREPDSHFVRPHMLLLRHAITFGKLSTFLRGSDAMAADPEAGWRNKMLVAASTYQGEVTFGGLKCHKIWITSKLKSTGAPIDRWELWLAESRNYLPLRALEYRFSMANDIPSAENTGDDLRELKPGIWFPFAATAVHYEPMLIKRKRRQVPRWQRKYVVETASLNPRYPLQYFQELTIPKGTAVYEISNGKISKSYSEGGIPVRSGGGTAPEAKKR